jgi:phage gpG-like protein
VISVQIVGTDKLIAKLNGMSARVRVALLKAVTGLSFDLMSLVKRKLSGDVLNVRKGKLRDSIFQRVYDDAKGVRATVASAGVVYARIHEYGGVINIPEIRPVASNVLHFMKSGDDIFAMYARAHTVTMPERSYMRSSLADMKSQIVAEMTAAVKGSVK